MSSHKDETLVSIIGKLEAVLPSQVPFLPHKNLGPNQNNCEIWAIFLPLGAPRMAPWRIEQ